MTIDKPGYIKLLWETKLRNYNSNWQVTSYGIQAKNADNTAIVESSDPERPKEEVELLEYITDLHNGLPYIVNYIDQLEKSLEALHATLLMINGDEVMEVVEAAKAWANKGHTGPNRLEGLYKAVKKLEDKEQ